WSRQAAGAQFEMPAPRGIVQRVDCQGGRAIVLATSRLDLLDLRSGKVLRSFPTSLNHSPRPLVAMQDDLVVVPSADEVVCLARGAGARRWSFQPEGQTTRTGEPPLVVPAGDSVLVVVPLNIGQRVYRLGRQTGKPLWREPLLLGDAGLRTGAWVVAGETIY